MTDYKERDAAPAAPRIGFGCIKESIFRLDVLRESAGITQTQVILNTKDSRVVFEAGVGSGSFSAGVREGDGSAGKAVGVLFIWRPTEENTKWHPSRWSPVLHVVFICPEVTATLYSGDFL